MQRFLELLGNFWFPTFGPLFDPRSSYNLPPASPFHGEIGKSPRKCFWGWGPFGSWTSFLFPGKGTISFLYPLSWALPCPQDRFFRGCLGLQDQWEMPFCPAREKALKTQSLGAEFQEYVTLLQWKRRCPAQSLFFLASLSFPVSYSASLRQDETIR